MNMKVALIFISGPSGWGLVNPNCDGRRQSPIAITTENTSVNYSLAAFPRSIFDTHARALLIKNNGHSRK